MDSEPESPRDLPWWNFDGSSTGQAEESNSDICLKPVAIFKDPFMLGRNKLVMCETYKYNKEPTGQSDAHLFLIDLTCGLASTKRFECDETMLAVVDEHPWFRLEQKYTLLAEGWSSSSAGTVLLWCGCLSSTGSRYCRGTLQSLHVRRSQHQWKQC